MEIDAALKIIRSLADGIDPVTGKAFPPDSPYQNPDSIRALMTAAEILERIEKSPAKRIAIGGNVGKPWLEEEDNVLRSEFEKKVPYIQMARNHKRTLGGIMAHLARLGLIEENTSYKMDRPG
jgi:hypothetical protein